MDKKQYNTFIMGHISIDEILYEDTCEKNIGGAVIYSSYAAKAGGNNTGVLTKLASKHMDLLNNFNIPKENIYCLPSKNTTSIRNKYLSILFYA